MSKKSFKPPEKTVSEKPSRSPRQKGISLTDEQYDELFNAVLHPSQNEVKIKSPSLAKGAESPAAKQKAASPRESASVENSQCSKQDKDSQSETNTGIENEKCDLEAWKNTESTLSTINSEKINENAVCSTPKQTYSKPVKRMKSYRESIKSWKKRLNDSSSSASDLEKIHSILGDSIVDVMDEGPFSQPPKNLDRRSRLMWLQERRGENIWVMCDRLGCNKWRHLNIQDPVDLPQKWYCDMNEDKAFASCSVPAERIPMYKEEDMIHNCYTAGSIVWARAPSFCWWPAMVDDCPDTEQFYWLDDETDDVPTWYHVIFFDMNDVSRIWLPLKDLKPYKYNQDLDRTFTVKPVFKKRFAVSKEKANLALTLSIKERLKKYSFISLWKKPLPDFSDSESDIDIEDDFNVSVNKIIQNRKNRAKAFQKHKDSFIKLSQDSKNSSGNRKNTKENNKKRDEIKENSRVGDKKKEGKKSQASEISNSKVNKSKTSEKSHISKKSLPKDKKIVGQVTTNKKPKSFSKTNISKATWQKNFQKTKENGKSPKTKNTKSVFEDKKDVLRRMSLTSMPNKFEENDVKNEIQNDFEHMTTRLNKSAPLFETKKEEKVRRHSLNSLFNEEENKAEETKKTEELYNKFLNLFQEGKMNLDKFKDMCEEIQEKSPSSSQKSLKNTTPKRRMSDSSCYEDKQKRVVNKKMKQNKDKSPKNNKVVKRAKKNFIPPYKRAMNTSNSSISTLSNLE